MEDSIHSISFFDSYLKQQVTLDPAKTTSPGHIKYYSCGPTVYSTQHIGNMRGAWFPATFVQIANLAGWSIELVHNVTDVGHLVDDADQGEDKIEKGAKRDGKSVQEIIKYYLGDYLKQTKLLGIELPSGKYQPKATEYIPSQMILALSLVKHKKAYILEDGIYFDSQNNLEIIDHINELPGVPKTPGNSQFTKRDIKNTTKNPADFALWKFVDPHSLQKWKFKDFPEAVELIQDLDESYFDESDNRESLLAKYGAPGWHSECVAMITKILARREVKYNADLQKTTLIDLHSGGEEHIPVHHKNEILQAESLGYHLSKYWVHWKHVLVDGTKMSKSLENTYTVHDIQARGFDPLAYRLVLMEHHYSEQLNFTWEKLEQSQNRLHNLRKEVSKIRSFNQSPNLENLDDDRYLSLKNQWLSILCEDLNIPKFLDVYQEYLHKVVNRIQSKDIMAIHDHKALSKFDSKFLNLKLFNLDLPEEILDIGEQRWTAKQSKDYKKSDELRQLAHNKGWQIDDFRWGWGIWYIGINR
ncbi:MAG: hypothetical protein AAGF07_02645 [Patescibacteria group bacterium]